MKISINIKNNQDIHEYLYDGLLETLSDFPSIEIGGFSSKIEIKTNLEGSEDELRGFLIHMGYDNQEIQEILDKGI